MKNPCEEAASRVATGRGDFAAGRGSAVENGGWTGLLRVLRVQERRRGCFEGGGSGGGVCRMD